MNLTLKQLRAVAALARTTHYRKAAEALELSQPSLTRLIKAAEESLGVALFDRHTRNVQVTSVGQEVAEFAEDVQQLSDRHFARIDATARGMSGTLAIATLPSLAATVVASAIETFTRTRPDVHIDLIDLPNHLIEIAIAKGHYDLGIGTVPVNSQSELRIQMLFADELFLVVPTTHRFAGRDTVSLEEAVQDKIIASRKGTGLRDLTERLFVCNQSLFKPSMELNQMGSILGLIRAGIGIGFLPHSALPGQASDIQLKFVQMEKPIVREICLLQRPGARRNPRTEYFTQKLREQINA